MSALQSPEDLGLSTLFLDLNSYFASVEQNENPSLMGKPVAVLPTMTDATCAIAASYEAKAYGVKTGTPIYEAKKLCPQLTCVLARHDKYVEYHHKILAATEKHIPVSKIWSIDEFHCDLMGREKQEQNARALAAAIKRQIAQDVGPAVRCSIGIASNSFLAKVATDMQKPDGLVILSPETLPGRLLDLALTDLPGINVRMQDRLLRARIRTVEDFWNTSPKQARAIWGSVLGERFWYWLHGYNPPHVLTHTSMVGHSRVLDPAMRTPEKARLMARRLLYKAVLRLRRTEFQATRLSFSVRFLDGARWADETSFCAAKDIFTIIDLFDTQWEYMCHKFFRRASKNMPDRLLCKKVSVILHGLVQTGTITGDLFRTEMGGEKLQHEKRESLSRALETLNKKYHKDAVSIGIIPKTLSGHVGTKIAFSRVPDMDEFTEG